MFRSFLRFGSILVNSAIHTSIDSIKKIKDEIVDGGKKSNFDDDVVFKNNVDPDIEKELGLTPPLSDDSEQEISANPDILQLTRKMTIRIEQVEPDGFVEDLHGQKVNFDLIKAKLIEPIDLLDIIYFIGKDIEEGSQWLKVGAEFKCRLQNKYGSGDLYRYLEKLIASKDEADDYVIPVNDVENIARPGSSDERYL